MIPNHVCQLDSLIKFAECYWPLSAGSLGDRGANVRNDSRSNDDSNLSHYCSEIYSVNQECHFKKWTATITFRHFRQCSVCSALLAIWGSADCMNRPFLILKGDFLTDFASNLVSGWWFSEGDPRDDPRGDPKGDPKSDSRGELNAFFQNLYYQICSGHKSFERRCRFVEFEIKLLITKSFQDCHKWLMMLEMQNWRL